MAATILTLLVAFVAAGAPGSEAGGVGSTFNSGPAGGRAAYLALRELGYTVERSHEPAVAVTADPAATVLVLASPLPMMSESDVRAIQAFLERGGIVLATGVGGARLLGGKPHERDHTGSAATLGEFPRAVDTPLTSGAPSITMEHELSRPHLPDGFTPLYGSTEERIAMTASVGEGQAIWWAGSSPLTNGAIRDAGNFEHLLNVLGDGQRAVLWDEHYHGHGRTLWSYVNGTPLRWGLAQALLLGAAALFTWSRRPGPLRPIATDPRTDPMEFVDTVGRLYGRARVTAAAVRAARRRLRRRLAAACGVSTDAPDDRMARLAAARLETDAEALIVLLGDSEAALAGPAPTRSDALALVARLQAASAAVGAAPVRGWTARPGGTARGRRAERVTP